MEQDAREWMTAAACAEGPRPQVTFADLPPQHQEDVLHLVLVAAASTTYFVALLVFFSVPLASRSLASDATLLPPGPARSAALDARLVRAAIDSPPTHPRTSRPRPAVALAALTGPAGGPPATNASPRRNPFTRFFRGVLRTVVSPSA